MAPELTEAVDVFVPGERVVVTLGAANMPGTVIERVGRKFGVRLDRGALLWVIPRFLEREQASE